MTTASLRDETSLVYRFDADTQGAFWLARQLCEKWLRECHVRSDVVCDLLLVMTELCTGAHEGVVLRADATGDTVEISVESAADVLPVGPAGDLRLAAALCDEVVIRVASARTVVTARRHGVILPA